MAEREVPLLGVELVDAGDALPGVRSRIAQLFIAIPWPPSWPWQRNPAAVPFLRLHLEHQREKTAVSFDAVTSRVSLSLALNREMDLVVRRRDGQPSALEVIRGLGKRRSFELSYLYAFGREDRGGSGMSPLSNFSSSHGFDLSNGTIGAGVRGNW